jgi:DNA protecting protein dprA
VNNIVGMSNAKLKKLFAVFDTPEEIYKASDRLLESVNDIRMSDIMAIKESRKDDYIYRKYSDLERQGIRFTYPGQINYPDKLLNIYDYPYIMYYKGKLPDTDKPSVAIVGARNCTEYGRMVAQHFGESFAGMGLQVISGMALGIDAAAQKGAIKNGGYSLAVLGCGVDICYPRTNIELYTHLNDYGGIISEYPPGTAPRAGLFPMRNRIISAMADALVVVEARQKSGSLITADQALEQNRDVYVVPGRIGDALSEGCLKLIKEGAQVITSPMDIMATKSIELYYNRRQITDDKRNNLNTNSIFDDGFKKSGLASPKNMVYSQINLFPVSLETIINNSGISLVEAEGILLELELDGLIEEVSKNYYIRKHI